MKLIYIHGVPAVGKATVAHALQRLIPDAGLLENTDSIDFARRVMDIDERGFWSLVFEIRERALSAALMSSKPYLIATACFAAQDLPWLERTDPLLELFDSELLPVNLVCETEELERRVGNPDRVARRKLTDVDGLRAFIEPGFIMAVPRSNLLTIDTTVTPPETAARLIAREFNLGNFGV
jgi:chloramphenicol 3-O-phosphotransferase